jgi:hypothetical protein
MSKPNEQSTPHCWHKEIDDEGICKNCGAKAAIKLEGLSRATFQGRSVVDMSQDGNPQGQTTQKVEVEQPTPKQTDLERARALTVKIQSGYELTELLAAEFQRLREEMKAQCASHWPIGELGDLQDFRCSCGAVLICNPTQDERIAAWKSHIRAALRLQGQEGK